MCAHLSFFCFVFLSFRDHSFIKTDVNRTLEPVYKDHQAFLDVTESMGIMGYQAATDGMELKVRGAWQVPLDHVVRREK